ncbi:hypothetical protein GXP71_19350 [Cellulomonas sp. H30R-01]|uniref:hypothetical protein n=1 Tax=Cellulomonas sp. H30R-01 TaxID=2704467 RepID=UPI00138C661A|nr:hypothetical protein [Cellulomonas sp. H30R-01]QHT58025.1 hypothetical protein GXP71_19350 [Cellulomonas sp. H30R-01]
MLYHIRVDGSPGGADLEQLLREHADVVATPTPDGTVLSCRLPDTAALTGVVALLHDLGLVLVEAHAVPDPAED